jgi:CelD/BcsL family acetyltransferase involved in cellulose biosynthesis
MTSPACWLSSREAAILRAQPFSWDGMANPFAELPRRPTPSSGYAVSLGDFAALYEKRLSKRSRHALERNARKLTEAGPLEFGWAETRDQKLALLDTLFAQKSRQFAAMGVKDIFDAHARAFYREVALLEGDNPSRVRLGYLKLGDTVLAQRDHLPPASERRALLARQRRDAKAVPRRSLAEASDRGSLAPRACLLRHRRGRGPPQGPMG